MCMTTLLPTLVVTCFSLVVGILTPLVWVERPILSLLLDVANAKVKDENIRSVQSFIRHSGGFRGGKGGANAPPFDG